MQPRATAMNEGNVLRIEREFSASPEAVYNAWVDPETLIKWWGPEGMTTPEYELNTHEGGHWTTTMQNSEGNRVTTSGVYKILEPPSRLVFTWAWTQDDGSRGEETEVEIRLTPTETGTRMVLIQGKFGDAGNRDNHNFGWNSSFNDLDKLFG